MNKKQLNKLQFGFYVNLRLKSKTSVFWAVAKCKVESFSGAQVLIMVAVSTCETSVNILPDLTAQYRRRPSSSYSPAREPDISRSL